MEFDMWKKKKNGMSPQQNIIYERKHIWFWEEHLKWSKMTHQQMLKVHIQFWKLFSWTWVLMI